mgnify:CR=1 FL=1
MTTIPAWVIEGILGLIALLLAIVGFFVSLGIKRLLDGQDTMSESHGEMKTQLTRTCGNVEASNERIEAQQKACDERAHHNEEEHMRVWDVIEKIRR